MDVTRKVITDLLPSTSQAKPATITNARRRLFRRDPQFAEMAKQEWSRGGAGAGCEPGGPDADAQPAKQLLRRRSIFLGAAIFLTCLPFSVLSIRSGTYILWRDMPQIAAIAALFGVTFWSATAGRGIERERQGCRRST